MTRVDLAGHEARPLRRFSVGAGKSASTRSPPMKLASRQHHPAGSRAPPAWARFQHVDGLIQAYQARRSVLDAEATSDPAAWRRGVETFLEPAWSRSLYHRHVLRGLAGGRGDTCLARE